MGELKAGGAVTGVKVKEAPWAAGTKVKGGVKLRTNL